MNETERLACARRVALELQSLSFAQTQLKAQNSSETKAKSDDVLENLIQKLQEEREDWFSELSGGQKSTLRLTLFSVNLHATY